MRDPSSTYPRLVPYGGVPFGHPAHPGSPTIETRPLPPLRYPAPDEMACAALDAARRRGRIEGLALGMVLAIAIALAPFAATLLMIWGPR